MTNNKLFLLWGTSLSLVPQTISAQCISPVQDCYSLGYTQTSCPSGKGVKCPFGNGWYCGGTAAQDCIKLGYDKDCTEAGESGSGQTCNGKYQSCTCDSSYQYICSGTGYSGGSGSACGGMYTSCECESGYEWKDGSCQISCVSVSSTCTIGTIYYSDGTCSSNKVSGKTLLGVVIYEKTTCENGWIITVNPIQTGIQWGGSNTDIPGLANITSESSLTDTQASCTNTTTITNYGSSSTYPAAWAAKNYKPTGTPSGKSWCLPSGGLLNSALNNNANLAKVNAGITTAGGKKIGYGSSSSYENVWSSSEHSNNYIWSFYVYTSGAFSMLDFGKYIYDDYSSVRPVMEF